MACRNPDMGKRKILSCRKAVWMVMTNLVGISLMAYAGPVRRKKAMILRRVMENIPRAINSRMINTIWSIGRKLMCNGSDAVQEMMLKSRFPDITETKIH
jgi:hypothetical protein